MLLTSRVEGYTSLQGRNKRKVLHELKVGELFGEKKERGQWTQSLWNEFAVLWKSANTWKVRTTTDE
jgi:hypothetical protein